MNTVLQIAKGIGEHPRSQGCGERRSTATSQRIGVLAGMLTRATSDESRRECAVCGRPTRGPREFVIPVAYVAACLVANRMEDAYLLPPLRRAALCSTHSGRFSALFVDIIDPRWDVERLELQPEFLGVEVFGRGEVGGQEDNFDGVVYLVSSEFGSYLTGTRGSPRVSVR